MNRLRPALVGLLSGLVLMVLAAGCSFSDPPALTVQDWTLSRSQLLDELDALEQSPGVAQFLGLTPSASPAVALGGSTTTSPEISTSNTAALLDAHVQIRTMGEVHTSLGLEQPGEAELIAVRQQLDTQLQQIVPAELEPLYAELVLAVAQQAAIEQELLGDFDAQAEARALYDEQVEAGASPSRPASTSSSRHPRSSRIPPPASAARPILPSWPRRSWRRKRCWAVSTRARTSRCSPRRSPTTSRPPRPAASWAASRRVVSIRSSRSRRTHSRSASTRRWSTSARATPSSA